MDSGYTRPSHTHERLDFPKNFLWGTATSAHQVEGDNDNNMWWAWEQEGKLPFKSGKATDHYNRYEEDFSFITKMHNNAYRLSIEWSRLQRGMDVWDKGELQHYRDVLQELKNRGITTFVTLHHFTDPIWFMERGGWFHKNAPLVFAEFAQYVAKNLGDLIDFWITINEPTVYAGESYVRGKWPPGEKSIWKMLKIFTALENAHKQAYKAIKNVLPSAQVGMSHSISSYQLYRPHHILDKLFVWAFDRFWNHKVLRNTKGYFDFIGMNYYFHYRIEKFTLDVNKFFLDPSKEDREVSDLGWEVYPPGITQALLDINMHGVPIYITENGVATENDDRRVRYLLGYLEEIHAAIRAGVDVRGYFYWSLLDNYEWFRGFGPRFGLVHVDYNTFKRELKNSGRVYAEIAKNNGIEHKLLKYLGHGISVPKNL